MVAKQLPQALYIIIIYRPPSLSLTNFYDNLHDLLVAVASKFKTCDTIFVGDFKIILLSPENFNIFDLGLRSFYNLYPTIYPTRVCQNSVMLIESIFTNINCLWLNGVIDGILFDHYLIFNCAYARQTSHGKNTPKQDSYIYRKTLIQRITKLN